jgi:uncharacterized membrane protein
MTTLTPKQYVVALVLILGLDAIWISSNRKMYGDMVRSVQGSVMHVRQLAAVVAYVLMYVGLVVLVLPALLASTTSTKGQAKRPSLAEVVRVAGLYGFTVYGIYNATNMAIFKAYPLKVALMDTAWGTFVYTFTAWAVTRL